MHSQTRDFSVLRSELRPSLRDLLMNARNHQVFDWPIKPSHVLKIKNRKIYQALLPVLPIASA